MSFARMLFALAFVLISAKGTQTRAEDATDRAKYDDACAEVVATIISQKEGAHSDFIKQKVAELPTKIKLCNEHPVQTVCQNAVKAISEAGSSAIKCAGAR